MEMGPFFSGGLSDASEVLVLSIQQLCSLGVHTVGYLPYHMVLQPPRPNFNMRNVLMFATPAGFFFVLF